MENNNIILSPINYIGNKLTLINFYKSFMPKDIDTFYDLFGGSGIISANVEAKKIIYNDINKNLVILINNLIYNKNDECDISKIPLLIDINSENKQNFQKLFQEKNIKCFCKKYTDFLSEITPMDFVYLDPPYYITAKNPEKCFWNEKEEKRLYAFLDLLNEKKIRFMMSNMIQYEGKTNFMLKTWCKKNNIPIIINPQEQDEIIIKNY